MYENVNFGVNKDTLVKSMLVTGYNTEKWYATFYCSNDRIHRTVDEFDIEFLDIHSFIIVKLSK